jgi:hypothetical protein
MPARQNWFDGWRLFALLSLTLLALSIWIAGMRGFEVDGVRMVIRFTARTSLVLFCLAFAGTALALMWPNAWTRWLRRNRRYLGVSFAASHAIHAVAIAAFAAGSRRLCGGDLDRVLHLRRHRLRLHNGDDRDLVRPHGRRNRRTRLAPAASYRRLLPAVPVHGVVRQADSRHAALRAVPDPTGGRVRAADDRDGATRTGHGADGMI